MPDTIKLRRLDTAKGLTSAELESINYNWWSIEQGLNSCGAVTPIPGGGSGGVSPGGTISHHSLLDLTDGDDHIQYLFLNGRTGGQTLFGGKGPTEVFWLDGTSFVGTPTTARVTIGGHFSGLFDAFHWLQNARVCVIGVSPTASYIASRLNIG